MNYKKYKDYERNLFVAKVVQEKWPEVFVRYEVEDEENYGHDDCTLLTTGGTEYLVEVKAVSFADVNPESDQCVDASTWKKNTQYVFAPMSGETWSGVTKEWVGEMNDTLDGIQNFNGYDYITSSPDKYYFLNAASKWEDATGTKAHGLFNDSKGLLAYLGRDGILLFNHKNLIEAHRTSGCVWRYQAHFTEDGEEMKAKGKEEMSWELKALINLSYGTFIPCDVPEELLDVKKKK